MAYPLPTTPLDWASLRGIGLGMSKIKDSKESLNCKLFVNVNSEFYFTAVQLLMLSLVDSIASTEDSPSLPLLETLSCAISSVLPR